MADDVLRQGIQGISEVITVPGLINLDFADVRTIMSEGGAALMAVGTASGDDRARKAAEMAVSSNLLDVTIDGARGILFNVTGGPDMSLFEVNEAAAIIKETAHPDVQLIFGAVIDDNMREQIRITVIATGFERPTSLSGRPAQQQKVQVNDWRTGTPAANTRQQQVAQPVPTSSQVRQPAPPPPAQPPVEPRESREQPPARESRQAPATPTTPPPATTTSNPYSSDDLDIPTFLRKR
jgi:cell division protein FtsZ